MSSKIKILLVEDDTNLGFLIVEYLESNGFDVKLYRDGESGLRAYENDTFSLCLFDVMLPGIDGFSMLAQLRDAKCKTPVIFITARSMKADKIRGFNLGADDYITKPFDEDELLCRINAVLNRVTESVAKQSGISAVFAIGAYRFDADNQQLTFENNTRRITQTESEVLKQLALQCNKIIKRNDLLIQVWGNDDYFTGRSLDVFITKLRKYLAADDSVSIESIPKVGFILHC